MNNCGELRKSIRGCAGVIVSRRNLTRGYNHEPLMLYQPGSNNLRAGRQSDKHTRPSAWRFGANMAQAIRKRSTPNSCQAQVGNQSIAPDHQPRRPSRRCSDRAEPGCYQCQPSRNQLAGPTIVVKVAHSSPIAPGRLRPVLIAARLAWRLVRISAKRGSKFTFQWALVLVADSRRARGPTWLAW